MSEDLVAKRVVVHGRVQGVMFRDSCRKEAERHDVMGWVRNEPDGTVAALFEGRGPAVDRLVAWCRKGPPAARVVHVDVTEVVPGGRIGFDVVG